jgi:hypothetical protein
MYVRGGTLNSPFFRPSLGFLLSSAMKKCSDPAQPSMGDPAPQLTAATTI